MKYFPDDISTLRGNETIFLSGLLDWGPATMQMMRNLGRFDLTSAPAAAPTAAAAPRQPR
jgi:hypothetical protein